MFKHFILKFLRVYTQYFTKYVFLFQAEESFASCVRQSAAAAGGVPPLPAALPPRRARPPPQHHQEETCRIIISKYLMLLSLTKRKI